MFNIYVTGYTEGIVDGGTLKGSRDVLVAKYNTSAVLQWARQLGDSYSEGKAIVTDDSFNVYVVGFTNGDFDGNQNLGGSDIIIVKYNSDGVKQWSKQYGTSFNDYGTGITIDSNNNIYITGHTIGGLYVNVTSGNYDVFVIKLNGDGIIQ